MKKLIEQVTARNKFEYKRLHKIVEDIYNSARSRLNESNDQWDKNKDNLYQHALSELRYAGFYDKDADYGGMIPQAVLEIMEVFCKQGHSGGSASIVIAILEKILRWENLTPISDSKEEWMSLQEEGPLTGWYKDMDPCWQSRRNPSLFSKDGGKTYYNVDDKDKTMTSDKKVQA